MDEGSAVVRARRFELVDEDGDVRAVLGKLGQHQGQGIYGLSLRVDGRERAWVVHGPLGPQLGFDQDGDVVAVMGVEEGGDALRPGPYLSLTTRDGSAVLSFPPA